MLDEPRWSSRFGGDSAAPVFARVCRGLASATSIFDDLMPAEIVAVSDRGGRRRTTPNFVRMERSAALQLARRTGNNVLVQGDVGRVVAQVPAPGVGMARNGVIRLPVTDNEDGRRTGLEGNARVRASYRAAADRDSDRDEQATRGAIARAVAYAGQAAVTAAMVGR
jgi:hypothetical protein